MSDTKVSGYCPMGCGQTLFLGSGGYVTCSYGPCPEPGAVADILADPETQHVVVLGPSTFSVQHPLRERLNGDLFRCDLHAKLTSLGGPPAVPGWYRVQWPAGQALRNSDVRDLIWTEVSGG